MRSFAGLFTRTFRGRALRSALAAIVPCALLAAPTAPARSQEQRAIRLIVPFQPGGSADILGRLLADQITKVHGQTFIVENRPGAGTVVATEAVSRAEPDGNTLLIMANSFVINPIMRKRNYDPLTSFEPICLLTRSPNIIAVHSASPYRTLQDLVTAARAKPGEVTMGFNGPISSQLMGYEKFKRATKVEMLAVTFSGGAPATNALLGQHVAALVANYPTVSELVVAGNLRVLAAMSPKRNELMLDIPTAAELGYPFEEDVWFGVVAPARTPAPVAARLVDWFRAAVATPELKPRFDKLGYTLSVACGKDFGAFLQAQHEDYSRIISASGMKTK
jgi:tripartite-type tricarboxylate transporter receptor subunit TctC